MFISSVVLEIKSLHATYLIDTCFDTTSISHERYKKECKLFDAGKYMGVGWIITVVFIGVFHFVYLMLLNVMCFLLYKQKIKNICE